MAAIAVTSSSTSLFDPSKKVPFSKYELTFEKNIVHPGEPVKVSNNTLCVCMCMICIFDRVSYGLDLKKCWIASKLKCTTLALHRVIRRSRFLKEMFPILTSIIPEARYIIPLPPKSFGTAKRLVSIVSISNTKLMFHFP